MSDYSSLKTTINANVKANNNQEITGSIMNSVLNAMVNSLGAGYQYMGVATPSNPGTAQTPDYKCFYLATTPGTYSNLGGLVVADGEIAILKWDTSWSREAVGLASSKRVDQLFAQSYQPTFGDFVFQPRVQDFEVGMLDANGDNYPHSQRIRTKIFIPAHEGDTLINVYTKDLYLGGNQGFNIFEYDENYNFIRSSQSYIVDNYTFGENCAYVRFFFFVSGQPVITQEIINAHYNEFFIIYKQRYSAKNVQHKYANSVILDGENFLSHIIKANELRYGFFNNDTGLLVPYSNSAGAWVRRIILLNNLRAKKGDIIRVPCSLVGDGVDHNVRIYYYDADGNYLGLIPSISASRNNADWRLDQENNWCHVINNSSVAYINICIDNNDNQPISYYEGKVEQLISYDNSLLERFQDIKIKQFVKKEFGGDNQTLDMTNLLIDCGVWDSGELKNQNNGFATILMAVKPFSEIVASVMSGCLIRLSYFNYYNSNSDKKFLKNVQFGGFKKVIVPEGANYVAFSFWKSNHSELTRQEILSGVTISVNTQHSYVADIEKIEDEFLDKKVLYINNYTEWKQGTANITQSLETNKCDTCKPIKVTPGHRYVIDWLNSAGIGIGVTGSNTQDAFGTWFGWQNYCYNAVIDIPNGINYIRLTGLKTDITPQDCIDANVKLIDVTTDPYHIANAAKKMGWLKMGSYAQGMTIENDLVFQAFANGTIEVRSLDGDLLDTINVPTPTGETSHMHCNNLVFSPYKYNEGEFGLLWLASNDIGTKMLACEITRDGNNHFSLSVVYEIPAPSVDTSIYKAVTQFYDFAKNKMVQVAYYDDGAGGYGDVQIFEYSVSSWDENAVFTLQHDFKVSKMWAMQGGIYQDDRVYLLAGTGGSSARINVFNIPNEKIEYMIDLRKPIYGLSNSEELQGIAFYEGGVYVSTSLWETYPNNAYCNLYKVSF